MANSKTGNIEQKIPAKNILNKKQGIINNQHQNNSLNIAGDKMNINDSKVKNIPTSGEREDTQLEAIAASFGGSSIVPMNVSAAKSVISMAYNNIFEKFLSQHMVFPTFQNITLKTAIEFSLEGIDFVKNLSSEIITGVISSFLFPIADIISDMSGGSIKKFIDSATGREMFLAREAQEKAQYNSNLTNEPLNNENLKPSLSQNNINSNKSNIIPNI